MATFDFPGLARLKKKLDRLGNPDASDLMGQWRQILAEGNRRGVLSGLDGNDQPMTPLKYRNGAGKTTRNRRVPKYGKPTFGPWLGRGANLTTEEYQKLTGPRLAPRGEESRVIRNLYTETRYSNPGHWTAVAAWRDVVSRKGFKFLPVHFEGSARANIPRYDLRPVRAEDYRYCVNAFRAWARKLLRVT